MASATIRHVGNAVLLLVIVFLALDAGTKLAGVKQALDATGELGFSPVATQRLGLLLAASTALYLAPATRTLGAVVLTGYLGGAVAVQALHGGPVATHVLFGVYVGIAV